MRALALLALLLLTACSGQPPVLPSPSPTPDADHLDITVLLDLSGPDAPLGAVQRDAMEAWLSRHTGGVAVRLTYVDVADDEAKLVLALKHAADTHASAVVVGSRIRYDHLVAQAVGAAAIPVLFTLSVPDPATTGGRWAFSLPPTPTALAEALVDDAAAHGSLGSVFVIGGAAETSLDERLALAAALQRQQASVVRIALPATDAARFMRVASVAVKAVFFVGMTQNYIEALKGVSPNAGGLYLSYLTTRSDVTALQGVAQHVAWPASRRIVDLSTDMVAATAGDALGMIASAYDGLPAPVTSDRLRLALETLTFSGVVTRYTFTPQRHSGFAPGDLALVRGTARGGMILVPPETRAE